ncbi:MAG: 30S ribosomal protein S19 [Rickettsiaceae bacterium]|nr:MAG: 30S ribosomal protein S19 [Rickettsiaceae bacterium]
MSRSLWKGPFAEIYLQKKSRIQTQSRRSVILPQYVGKEFQIYNGKHYLLVRATQDMIGHKLGEFATTRRKPNHKKKVKMRKSRK